MAILEADTETMPDIKLLISWVPSQDNCHCSDHHHLATLGDNGEGQAEGVLRPLSTAQHEEVPWGEGDLSVYSNCLPTHTHIDSGGKCTQQCHFLGIAMVISAALETISMAQRNLF